MSTNVSPSYLFFLVHQSVDHASSYNLRNSHNLQPMLTGTNLYYNSFLPSVIRDWNELPVVVRQLDSVCSFKNYLNRDFTPVPKYYLTGNQKSQILHTRLGTNCSSLNNDLFLKIYLTLHYAVVVALKTLKISSSNSLDTMNTEHCSLTRSPSTSQFLLICYYMEVVHFHMTHMLPSFKWYISTYRTLSVLLRYPSQLLLASGHNKSEDVVCDGINYCNLPIAYRPGLVSVFPCQHLHILFFIYYQCLCIVNANNYA